jgi:hypothetical protein
MGVKLDNDEGEAFLDEMVVAYVGCGVPLHEGNGEPGEGCEDKITSLGDLI